MDKRRTRADAQAERRLRAELYAAITSGSLSIGQAVAAMRRMSQLTQPEFARHRGLSVQSLRLIEADKANPTLETLDKIASIFGLQVGFLPQVPQTALRDVVQRVQDGVGIPPEDAVT